MRRAVKLGEAIINGKAVSFFTPPHAEPDFLWVDVLELSKAFVPTAAAKALVRSTLSFSKRERAAATARNGNGIATIICHSMAQGLMGAVDDIMGCKDEEGPAYREYCRRAADFGRAHHPMSVETLVAAFKNNGGPFMRGVNS